MWTRRTKKLRQEETQAHSLVETDKLLETELLSSDPYEFYYKLGQFLHKEIDILYFYGQNQKAINTLAIFADHLQLIYQEDTVHECGGLHSCYWKTHVGTFPNMLLYGENYRTASIGIDVKLWNHIPQYILMQRQIPGKRINLPSIIGDVNKQRLIPPRIWMVKFAGNTTCKHNLESSARLKEKAFYIYNQENKRKCQLLVEKLNVMVQIYRQHPQAGSFRQSFVTLFSIRDLVKLILVYIDLSWMF